MYSKVNIVIQLCQLRQEADSIVQDNEKLIGKLDKFAAAAKVEPDRYIFLAENAQIVADENELLKVSKLLGHTIYLSERCNILFYPSFCLYIGY